MPKFKNSTGGYLLNAMFYETTLADKSQVSYTLKREDHEGFPSLYRLYMEADDPTEYNFATAHLDGWDHWERLCECTWFQPYVTKWRRELEIRTRAYALLEVRAKAKDADSKESFQANKFLLAGGWKPPAEKRRVGAPSKEDVAKAAHDIAMNKTMLDDDLERIMTRN